jgi:hypothetical protein
MQEDAADFSTDPFY